MLTFDEIADELTHLTYKPGWKLIVYQSQHEGIWLSIIAETPDAAWPSRTTVLNIRSAVPPIPNREYLREWLLWRLLRGGRGRCGREPRMPRVPEARRCAARRSAPARREPLDETTPPP